MERISPENTVLLLNYLSASASDRALGRELGVSGQTIASWRNDGMPVTEAKAALFDIERKRMADIADAEEALKDIRAFATQTLFSS